MWQRIQKRPGKKKTEHFSVHLSGFSVGGHPLPLVPVRALPGASVAAAACGHCPRAEPAPREMREPQPPLLDSEDPSAWQCPQERSERTIRAGAAPSPVTAGRSCDQGPARRDGCGKARLWLLYHIVQEPKSLLVGKLHPEKKFLVTFLSPPRRRAVRPWICQGSPPRKAWRSFGSKDDTRLCCAPLLSSSPCCGWVPVLLGEK